jgi:hypothetical protein
MADVRAVEQALAGLRTGIQADGYDLQVDAVGDGVAQLRIVAGPNACAECLVPKALMTGTIKMSLRALPEITTIQLQYPLDR